MTYDSLEAVSNRLKSELSMFIQKIWEVFCTYYLLLIWAKKFKNEADSEYFAYFPAVKKLIFVHKYNPHSKA